MSRKLLCVIISAVLFLTACGTHIEETDMLGATDEMYSPEFWIKRANSPETLMMTVDDIERFNDEVTRTAGTNCVNIDEYAESLSDDELKKSINYYDFPTEDRYVNGEKVTETYYTILKENLNLADVHDINYVKYGFVVRETEIRTFPTSDKSCKTPDDFEYDRFAETSINTWERVIILHVSADKKWYLVQCPTYTGWVSADDIAIAKDKTEWQKYSDYDFLRVTGSRITLDENPYNAETSHAEFTMGTKLYLMKDKPDEIDTISTISSWCIILPGRNSSGYMYEISARVPYGADVCKGNLPYTQANIIRQAFKMSGERYGWADTYGARDSSGFVKDIYASFGILLPRNVANQKKIPCHAYYVAETSDSDKEKVIMQQPAGSMLLIKGYVCMYIGSYDGHAYIIQSMSSTGGDESRTVNCVAVASVHYKRNGEALISEVTNINTLKHR